MTLAIHAAAIALAAAAAHERAEGPMPAVRHAIPEHVEVIRLARQDPPEGGEAISAPAGAQNQPMAGELTDAAERAIERGFAFLLDQQLTDGSFGVGRYDGHTGITALSCLAFMADGHVPGRGEYGEAVQKGLEFILAHTDEAGFIVGRTESHGPMYSHGFAALFLGEIYGMNPQDDRVRDALVRAIQLIINSQNDEGGWRYHPVPFDADISVTICQIMALRSARNAGIKVPKETIDRAVEYVRACQNADGGFRYMIGTGGSGWPRTAAGVASLFYAGVYEDDAIERGLEYLERNAMPGQRSRAGEAHYFYGHYYAVQAMYLAGAEHWEQWWPAIRDELVQTQTSNGSWPDHYAGGTYATAMSLIILQMPKRYLPIFQK
jgi:hypothetical protein